MRILNLKAGTGVFSQEAVARNQRNILAIDPGLRVLGAALFIKGKLAQAHVIKNPCKTERGPKAWVAMANAVITEVGRQVDDCVVELMQLYAKGKAKPDDLMQLYGVAGAIVHASNASYYEGYLPKEWKSNVPKNIHNKRVLEKLEGRELHCLPPDSSFLHNAIDAVGIGLFYLGR